MDREKQLKVVLVSCIGTDSNVSNPNLLYHFIDHYREYGVTNWSLTLHMGIDTNVRNITVYQEILKGANIEYDIWNSVFDTYEREARHNEFVNSQTDETWIIGVDLDEFVHFPAKIPEYISYVDSCGYNCIGGQLIDRVSRTGELLSIDRYTPIKEQFPIKGEVKRNIYRPEFPVAPYEKKIALKKPLNWGLGHHFITRETRHMVEELPVKLSIDHYAWDDLLIPRIEQRLDNSWAQEYRNMIEYISNNGRLNLGDVQGSSLIHED